MKRALITGSAGFVGRHFARRLLAEGWTISHCDIREGIDCRDWFRSHPITSVDLVIHCAAIVGGRAKIDGDPLAIADNLSIDAALFRWAAQAHPGAVVYFSSSAAYPVQLQQRGCSAPLREDWISDMVALPDQTYGWAKLTGERLAAVAAAHGLRVHVVRPFSGYGEDQDLDYPFPAFAQRIREGSDPFEIWGDGTQWRDWIHIDDIVEAVMVMLAKDIRGPVNLGHQSCDFRTLAALMLQAAGRKAEIRPLPDKPTGVWWRVADTTRLREFYAPRVSLSEGIARALG